jgi:hypothetical protein
MTQPYTYLLLAALALPATVSLPIPAQAQPARIGNVWGGEAHEPIPGEVHGRERDAGVALSDQQAQEQQDELDRLGKQLSDQAAQDANAAGASNPFGIEPGGVVPVAPAPGGPDNQLR